MAEHVASLSGFPFEGARSGAFTFKPEPPTLEQAREVAHLLHADQVDKTGSPYHFHLDAVQQGAALLGCGLDAQIAALFHDAVEDGHATLENLRASGYSEETVAIVDALTKRKGETNAQYLVRIRETGPEACRVKVADLLHNTRHDRVEALRATGETWKDTERRLARYRRSLAYLLTQLGLIA